MILKELDQITLEMYKQCTLGNTLALHKGIKWNKKKLRKLTDVVYDEISDKLNEFIESKDGNLIAKMLRKMSANEVRLRIYVMCYQILSIAKDKRTIDNLAKNGFKYQQGHNHADNLYRLNGEIDRLNSIVFDMSEDFIKVTDKIKAVDTTIEDTIMSVNNAMSANLSLKSTLADLVAAHKILQKIKENNEK